MNYESLIADAERRVKNTVIDAKVNGMKELGEGLIMAFSEFPEERFSGEMIAAVIKTTMDDAELRALRRKK